MRFSLPRSFDKIPAPSPFGWQPIAGAIGGAGGAAASAALDGAPAGDVATDAAIGGGLGLLGGAGYRVIGQHQSNKLEAIAASRLQDASVGRRTPTSLMQALFKRHPDLVGASDDVIHRAIVSSYGAPRSTLKQGSAPEDEDLTDAALGATLGASLPTLSLVEARDRAARVRERIEAAPELTRRQYINRAQPGDLSGTTRMISKAEEGLPGIVQRGSLTAGGTPTYHVAVHGAKRAPSSGTRVHEGGIARQAPDMTQAMMGWAIDTDSDNGLYQRLLGAHTQHDNDLQAEKALYRNPKGDVRVHKLVSGLPGTSDFLDDLAPNQGSVLFRPERTSREKADFLRAIRERVPQGYSAGGGALGAGLEVALPEGLRAPASHLVSGIPCGDSCSSLPAAAAARVGKPMSSGAPEVSLPAQVLDHQPVAGVYRKDNVLRAGQEALHARTMAGVGAAGLMGLGGGLAGYAAPHVVRALQSLGQGSSDTSTPSSH